MGAWGAAYHWSASVLGGAEDSVTGFRDRAGRWLIRHRLVLVADQLARLVIWSQWLRPAVREMRRQGLYELRAGPYLPLWRERWTQRGDEPVPGTAGPPAPGDVTSGKGALATLAEQRRR
jgi:hypothetical protein